MSLAEELKQFLGDLEAEVTEIRSGEIVVKVAPDKLKDAATRLLEKGFDHVVSVEGVDYMKEKEMEVAYHVTAYEGELSKVIVALKTRVPRENPRVPSLIDIWPSALYPERETWEMLGIVFEGHPELKHLLLPPWWKDKPPLRKDFIVREEVFIVDLTRAKK